MKKQIEDIKKYCTLKLENREPYKWHTKYILKKILKNIKEIEEEEIKLEKECYDCMRTKLI